MPGFIVTSTWGEDEGTGKEERRREEFGESQRCGESREELDMIWQLNCITKSQKFTVQYLFQKATLIILCEASAHIAPYGQNPTLPYFCHSV